MTRTYVFGNPSGWTLYGGDASEHDYYRSFYVISRHGSRLMVNRREDGSVVYTYVHYDLIEGSDRMGAAHFGMSIVLENGQYTDDFNTVYRFLDALFHKSLERADSILKKSGNGKLRYNVTKLDDCRECIEWIKSMMPKIFDKTGLKSINSDSSFAEGQAGRIVMFETESNDAEILDAFRQCNWVAISSDYHKSSTQNPDTGSIKEEINLFDIQHQHSTITKTLLDISTGVTDYDIKIIEKIDRRINETRLTLINYINTNPDESDSVKSLQKQYSDLLVSLDAVKTKAPKPPHITISDRITTNHVDESIHNETRPHSSDSINNENADEPSVMDEIKAVINRNISKIGGVLAIIVIIGGISIYLLFFRNSPTIGMGDDNGQQEEQTEEAQDSTISIEDVKYLLAEKKFEETYNLIAETNSQDSLLMMNVLKDSIEAHLWTLVNVPNGNIEIASFFADNKNLMEKTGFTSDNKNGAIEWDSRAQLHSKLTTILASNNLTNQQLNEGLAIIQALGDRYAYLEQTLKSQYTAQKEAAQQNKHSTTNKTTKSPSKGNAWVEVNGERKTFESNSARGFEINTRNDIKIRASGRISYIENQNIEATHNRTRTDWTISFKAKGRYMFTLTHINPDNTNTEYQITITVNK